jgi:hypothetical protein
MTDLQEKGSDKRVIYILSELMTQVAEMQKVVGDKTNAGLERLKADLMQINAEYKKSASLRNMDIIRNKLIRLDKQLRQQYSPLAVKDDFK